MSVTVFQKSPLGPQPVQVDATLEQGPSLALESALGLGLADVVWVDMVSPDSVEEAAVEAVFNIDAPAEAERAALEESSRFYIENNTLVMNATVMARVLPDPKLKVSAKNAVAQHQRQIVSFFLTQSTLITVRTCTLRAFEINAGRASANLADDETAGDVLVSLVESLVERAADYLAASAFELEDLNVRVFFSP